MPIEFKVENEAFAKDGEYEVEYSTYINDVEIKTITSLKGLKDEDQQQKFEKRLQVSQPETITEIQSNSNAIV